jgi:hypothetical protein
MVLTPILILPKQVETNWFPSKRIFSEMEPAKSITFYPEKGLHLCQARFCLWFQSEFPFSGYTSKPTHNVTLKKCLSLYEGNCQNK